MDVGFLDVFQLDVKDLLDLGFFQIQTYKLKIQGIKLGHPLPSDSAIQCLVLGGNAPTKALALKVQKAGFDVRPILSPTVRKGSERLRISLHAFNTEKEVNGLVNSLKNHS